jgi:hypothetical protein
MVMLDLSEQDEKLYEKTNKEEFGYSLLILFLPRCNATAPPSERPNKKILS